MMRDEIRLLLVDDRVGERMALVKQLALSQADVVVVAEAGLGAEALTALEETGPDVVLISLEEPLARPLRMLEALSLTGKAPIIAVSSIGDRETLRKAMRAGSTEYLVRPLNPDELAKTIETVHEANVERRSLIRSGRIGLTAQGEVIAIMSAKGGTGKTTLATNLAVALATEGKRRVVVADLNLEQGDVPVMLDVAPEFSIMDTLPIIDRLESDAGMIDKFLHKHPSGVELLSGPPDPLRAEVVTREDIKRTIQLLARSFEYVVVDTAPNARETLSTMAEVANMVLLVTTPEIPCLKNTRIMLEMLKSQYRFPEKVKLVVNDAYHTNGTSHNEIAVVLDYPVFWKLPYDSFVSEAVGSGRPFVQAKTNTKISRNIVELARTLAGIPEQRKGLLNKLRR